MSGKKSDDYMAPKRKACPIPTGWTLENEVQKDGSKVPLYYCAGTGQHFYTYDDMIRYVEYAKSKALGIYSLSCKSVKRKRSMENDGTATESRETSPVLSIPEKPSSDSNSLTIDESDEYSYESSTSSESSDGEEDEDYVPESDGDVSADSEADPEVEVNQNLKNEAKDLAADKPARR